MKKIAAFVAGLPTALWLGAACVAVLAFAVWRIFDAGGDHVRAEVKEQTAEARDVTTRTAGEMQRDLDGATARIGEALAHDQVETVRIVERTRVEIRDAAVNEPDALPRLTAWRDRAQRLRDDLCVVDPAGADGAPARQCARAVHGPGAS